MIALGYDYGTTNSLLVRFTDNVLTEVNTDVLKLSSPVLDGNSSPKRLLNSTRYDKKKVVRSIEDFTVEIFKNMKNLAGDSVVLTVTVPNVFRDVECMLMREAVARACSRQDVLGDRISDDDVNILPEPIAAALYYVYGAQPTGGQDRYLVIFDVGGGTTDMLVVSYSIRVCDDKKYIDFKVKCTAGDLLELGGNDFDNVMIEVLCTKLRSKRVYFNDEYKYSLSKHAEYIKCRLSDVKLVSYELPDPDGNFVSLRVERDDFEYMMRTDGKLSRFAQYAEGLKGEMQRILSGEGVDLMTALSRCVLLPVGGSAKIPCLQRIMAKVFGCHLVSEGVFGEHSRYQCVARGAAIYSAWCAGLVEDVAEINIQDRTLHRIAIKYGGTLQRLETCVGKNFPSGEYSIILHPTEHSKINADSFRIGAIHLYEGEGDVVDEGEYPRTAHLKTLSEKLSSLNDPINIRGRNIHEIDIRMTFKIRYGRLCEVAIFVSGGGTSNNHSSPMYDYSKTIGLCTE